MTEVQFASLSDTLSDSGHHAVQVQALLTMAWWIRLDSLLRSRFTTAALRTSSPRTWEKHVRDTLHICQRDRTYHPSGKYLLTTRGIFFSRSSLIAICSGSVSPSTSTSTGAFMLVHHRVSRVPFTTPLKRCRPWMLVHSM